MRAAIVLAALLCASPALADDLTLGSTNGFSTQNTCPSSALATTRCLKTNVTCPNVDVREANLKITDPSGSLSGVILFINGGGGTGAYETQTSTTVTRMLDLHVHYRLVQIFWTQISGDNGPFTASASPTSHDNPLELMCRGATLREAIYSDTSIVPAATAFCATGQSGGSSQLGYDLAHYGGHRRYDAVVLSGGPPHGRLDRLCVGTRNSAWTTICQAYGGNPLCTFTGSDAFINSSFSATATWCTNASDGGTSVRLRKWSVDSIASTIIYPQTYVRFVWGINDASEAWPSGRQYADRVVAANPATADIPTRVANTSHIIPSTSEGMTAIRDALVSLCTYRHGS